MRNGIGGCANVAKRIETENNRTRRQDCGSLVQKAGLRNQNFSKWDKGYCEQERGNCEMIIVNCPHCGKQHVLLPDEIERLFRAGKVVITECSCGRMYTVEQGDDCYFTR